MRIKGEEKRVIGDEGTEKRRKDKREEVGRVWRKEGRGERRK